MTRNCRQNLIVFVALAGAGVIAYCGVLSAPFVFDDFSNIADNAAIRVTELTPAALNRAAFSGPSAGRPVANLSFACNYRLAGYDVRGYRLVNILIHIVTGCLVCLTMLQTLELANVGGSRQGRRMIAGVAAGLWLLHPAQTQAVTYIVQRMTSLCTMFYLAALLLYLQARRHPENQRQRLLSLGAATACWLLALGSKQIAITLPVLILAYELYFFRDFDWRWLRRYLPALIGGAVALLLIALLYLGGDPVARFTSGYEQRDFTMWQRQLTQFRVLVFYLSLFFMPLPDRFTLDRYVAASTSLLTPISTLLSLLLLVGLLILAIVVGRRQRLLSFCIFWYFLHLALESSIIYLEMAYDHRLYLPSMALSLVAVAAADSWLPHRPWLRPAVAALLAVGLLSSTLIRNRVWLDPVALWRDSIAKGPLKPRPHNNLGLHLGQLGRTEEALVEVEQALVLDPDYADAHCNMGILLRRQEKFDQAIAHYQRALALRPELATAHYNLGLAYRRVGRIDEAVAAYQEAIRYQSYNPSAYNNLGFALGLQGKFADAVAAFEAAVAQQPEMVLAQQNLEKYRSLLATGAVTPEIRAAALNIAGEALLRQQQYAAALAKFDAAIALQPAFAKAHNNRGVALRFATELPLARQAFETAVRCDPSFAEAYNNLGAVCGQLADYRAAVAHFREAIRLRPDYENALVNLQKAEALAATDPTHE